ncbi:MAG: 50S ribosomal protein L24 [Planctomycetaceae bacterium]|nr:50S ribosomal protein L24 [Planctomycetaceae bacterium]|tara:strand:- start:766 stop:1098 length:333 start_codon:yes stop_codon:yes gene_type:complete
MSINKNDRVLVIAGKDKGSTGTVLNVDRVNGRVTVAGVNIVKKTVRRSQQNPQGGIIDVEGPIHISNIMRIDEETGTARRQSVEGSGRDKQRIFKEHKNQGGRKTATSDE